MLLLLLPFFLHWCDPLLGELTLIYLFQLYMLHLQSIYHIHCNTSRLHFRPLYMLLLLLPFFLHWCGCSDLFLFLFLFALLHSVSIFYLLLFLLPCMSLLLPSLLPLSNNRDCSGLFLEFSFQTRYKDYMYMLAFLWFCTSPVFFLLLSKHDSISYALHKPLHQSDHI